MIFIVNEKIKVFDKLINIIHLYQSHYHCEFLCKKHSHISFHFVRINVQ